jgi:hypothetical protein
LGIRVGSGGEEGLEIGVINCWEGLKCPKWAQNPDRQGCLSVKTGWAKHSWPFAVEAGIPLLAVADQILAGIYSIRCFSAKTYTDVHIGSLTHPTPE